MSKQVRVEISPELRENLMDYAKSVLRLEGIRGKVVAIELVAVVEENLEP